MVHPDADLHDSVSVGPFTIIEEGVKIGEGTQVGPNVWIGKDTVIGSNCRIFHGASIGGEPQVASFKDVLSCVRIGDGTVIREYVTIHRSMYEGKATEVGEGCLLMAYAHLGHDCQLGKHVVVVNQTGLSGHVEVGDHAFISGMVGVHQFVRIGAHCMVGGFSGLRQDVLPYCTVEGVPARLISTNSVGLRRRNFSPQVRTTLKNAFKILREPELNTTQAVERIRAEIENTDEIRYLIDFIENTSRGIIK